MLYMIGLGLGGIQDISISSANVIRKCQHVILDYYTSLLPDTMYGSCSKQDLESFLETKIIIGYRENFENESDDLIKKAKLEDVALLIVGDVFCATTHSMIFLKCKKSDCDVKVIHNVSIFNAISITGLSLYTFGQTVSIVYFTETYQPESFYDKILENLNLGLHTLCLLDIRMHEPTADTILSKNPVYELPRCMKIHEAVEILLKISKKRNCKKITKDTLIVGAARVGTKTEKIVTMTMEQALLPHYIENMGATLHSFVIVGKLDLIEQDIIQIYKLKFDQ